MKTGRQIDRVTCELCYLIKFYHYMMDVLKWDDYKTRKWNILLIISVISVNFCIYPINDIKPKGFKICDVQYDEPLPLSQVLYVSGHHNVV